MAPRVRNTAKNKADDVSGQVKWTKGDTCELINLIKKQLKERDELSYSRRIKLLNWKQVLNS